jgi:hypothetical protein
MNEKIYNIFGLESNIELSKLYFKFNPSLFDNGDFIKNTFIKSITKSNIELVEYIYSKSSWAIDSMEKKEIFDLFRIIMINGNLYTIQWIYAHFNYIDLMQNNWEFLKLACFNRDKMILEWICTKCGLIPIEVLEDMFKIGLSVSNLRILKYIYELNSRIDLAKMNLIIMNSEFFPPSASINLTIEWLKTICTENNYTIRILEHNQLNIIDNFQIKTSGLDVDLINIDEKICQLCMENPNNVISNCSHQYCKYCIRQWINKNNSCPFCRKSDNIEFYFFNNNIYP